MKIRVLGCSGAEFPGHNPSAFLVDDSLLLDAGTVGAVLDEDEQWRIRNILVTHAHLDHIRGIPLLADNIVVKGVGGQVKVLALPEVIRALREHLLNGVIWPDFAVIPSVEEPVIVYQEIEPGRELLVEGYSVTPYRMNHAVPALGYLLSRDGKTVAYTGDTGPTEEIWQKAGGLSAVIVEVSFPNEMEELALLTGHLTPMLLEKELSKLPELPPRILITHLKPQYYEPIKGQLDLLPVPGIHLLREGEVIEL